MSTILEEFRAEGEVKNEIKTLLKILSRLGTVPDALTEKLRSFTDIDELDHLTDIALDCRSVDEFEKHML